jgi:4-amino-4-deoxy-L-arabinose transferase-like glycosyltransferase
MKLNWQGFFKKYFVLFIIILFFLFTRLFRITQAPPSVYWDEASIGYNAFSVLKTGRDEWGEFLPLHFRAFGEFKLPVYIYATIPFIKLFGLNAFSIRVPSVFFSLGSLVLVYLLGKALFDEKVALISAFLFSITPWMFIFSRTAYEATAGLMFCLAAIYFLLRSEEHAEFFIAFVLCLIFSFYSYNSFRIISPLVFLASFLYLFSLKLDFKKNLKIIVVSVIVFLLSLLPTIKLMFLDYGALRFQSVAVQGGFREKISAIITNYFSHFSYNFLFGQGDTNLRSNMAGFGELYLFSLPFMLIGIYFIIKNWKKYYSIIFLLLISPIPASLTKEAPHALRAVFMAPFIILAVSYGVFEFSKFFKRNSITVLVLIIVVYASFGESYVYKFFTDYSRIASEDWQYGYKQIFENYKEEFKDFDKVIIADDYGQPYIFALFYMSYSSDEFRNEVSYNLPDKWGISTVESFSKFYFVDSKSIQLEKNSLVFSLPESICGYNRDSQIKFLNGDTAFYIYKI